MCVPCFTFNLLVVPSATYEIKPNFSQAWEDFKIGPGPLCWLPRDLYDLSAVEHTLCSAAQMRSKKQAIAKAAEMALAHLKTMPLYAVLQPPASLWQVIRKLMSPEVSLQIIIFSHRQSTKQISMAALQDSLLARSKVDADDASGAFLLWAASSCSCKTVSQRRFDWN